MWCYQFAKMQNVAEAKGWTKFVSMQNHYRSAANVSTRKVSLTK